MNKVELRKEMALRKRAYSLDERQELSKDIMALLECHPRFVGARTLLLYHALPDEVETAPFIRKWCGEKRIVLPVVVGDSLELRLYEDDGHLQTGAYGILEPTGALVTDLATIDLAVIPGVAFDRQGNRLGRGKGYYDRLLCDLPSSVYKLGLCFPFQKVEEIPTEPHDKVMDEVL